MIASRSIGAQLAESAHRLVDQLMLFGRSTRPALILGAAVFAYFNQPVIRFMDAYPAYEGAAVTAMGLILMTAAMTVRRDFLGIIFGIAAFVVGTMWLGDAFDDAVKRAARNDNRCFRIENEMLSTKPPRDDLPELYQALGCRPISTLYMMKAPAGR